MSIYTIENFRPTQVDVTLLVVSGKAAEMPVGRLLRQRTGDDWNAPDMPPFRNRAGEEYPDREWVDRHCDCYAESVILTPTGLELLTEALIKDAADEWYMLQFQVSRIELADFYYVQFRLGRALDALEALGSSRWRELADSYAPEMEKAHREGREDAKRDPRDGKAAKSEPAHESKTRRTADTG